MDRPVYTKFTRYPSIVWHVGGVLRYYALTQPYSCGGAVVSNQ